MTTYDTSQFKGGLKVMVDGDPCTILENEFVKPGKGQAFNRVKYKNLKTGRTLERTFRSGETLPGADVSEVEMQYLYNDGQFWHFMIPDNYEQHAANEKTVGDAKKWLKEQDICIVTMWNGLPLSIQPPIFVEMAIIETDPGIRGDTATGGTKPAKLETGVTVKVPLFVNEGEIIKVDTRTGAYVSRVSKS